MTDSPYPTIAADLKPCPFCGSKDVELQVFIESNYCSIHCLNCAGRTGLAYGNYDIDASWANAQKRAIDAWNRRV